VDKTKIVTVYVGENVNAPGVRGVMWTPVFSCDPAFAEEVRKKLAFGKAEMVRSALPNAVFSLGGAQFPMKADFLMVEAEGVFVTAEVGVDAPAKPMGGGSSIIVP
jgi:hypothetical protein